MKRNVVQHLMRDDNQPLLARNHGLDWGNQLTIQVLQMMASCLQKQYGMFGDVLRLKLKLRKLEIQSFERGSDGACVSKIPDDPKLIPPDDESLKAIRDGVVLHQQLIGFEHLLDVADIG